MATRNNISKRGSIMYALELAQVKSAKGISIDVRFDLGSDYFFVGVYRDVSESKRYKLEKVFVMNSLSPDVEHRINMLAKYGYNPLSPVHL